MDIRQDYGGHRSLSEISSGAAFPSHTPNLQGFKRLGEPKAAVESDPIDLLRFIERNFIPLNTMMERAGMSEMDIFHYFKLPYDAPPPEE
jgi:hypothetical protein